MTVCSGWLLIAEVKSRLDPNTGGADPVKFVKAVCELGYTSVLKVCMFIFQIAVLINGNPQITSK